MNSPIGSRRAVTPEGLAQLFHEAYERLAPGFGYRTREASAKPWAEVPADNKALMTATCAEVLTHLAIGTGSSVWDPATATDPIEDLRAVAERARRGELPDKTAERAADDAAAVHRASVSALVDFLMARFAEDPRGVAPDGPWLREASPYELRRAAVRYAGHPDYREEWRPEPAPDGAELAPVLPFGPVDPETARLMLWYAVEALAGVPDCDERICAVAEEHVQRLEGRATAMRQAADMLRGSAELSAQLDEQKQALAVEAALDRQAAVQLLTVVREMAGLSPETRAERQLLGARGGGR